MQIFSDNLKFLRGAQTQQQVADKLLIKRERYYTYEEGREPPYDILIQISNLYGITVDILLTVDLRKTDIDHLVKIGKNRLLLPIMVDENRENRIELVTHKAKAGYRAGYADSEFVRNLPYVVLPFLVPDKFRGFPIDGDSMPPYNEKTFIFGKYVEKLSDVIDDKTYVVLDKTEGIVYKRLYKKDRRTIIAKSDNDFYKPYEIDGKEILEARQFGCAVTLEEYKPGHYSLPEKSIESMFLDIKQEIKSINAKIS